MDHPIKRALISVSDKTNLIEFGKFLSKLDVEILSTGGTAAILRDSGIIVSEVADVTGFPEIMDGRIKTLQPIIHGGLLAIRGNVDHERSMLQHSIQPIDLLVVNLYPFETVVSDGGDFGHCIENIDIGGPALIRAGAKNHAFVTVVVDPEDYGEVMQEIEAGEGITSKSFRTRQAAKAYSHTASYDSAISGWFNEEIGEIFPKKAIFSGELRQTLRYGENPHQKGSFYSNSEDRPGIASAEQLQGKELSYNNLNDTDAAFELVAEYSTQPACVIVKHANPCGVALGTNLTEAYKRALACDTESAFGGILAFNQSLDGATATECIGLFFEVIIAPNFSEEALNILSTKKNIRVLATGGLPSSQTVGYNVRTLAGGYLVQTRDNKLFDELTVVTKRSPSEREMADLKFALPVVKHIKSNAIVYAKDKATVGVGAGQMSRVNSSRIATWKAADAAKLAGDNKTWALGSVVASDAFFPFADGLLAAAEAGATAVIQPGGSVRDEEIIAAADEADLSMIFTGVRHFRH